MDIIKVSFVDLEFKADSDASGEFSGYGSTFGNVDNGKDVCVKGCFADSIKAMLDGAEQRPLMLWMHKQDEPIGEWKTLMEDDKGLKVEGQLWIKQGIPNADRAYKLLKSKSGGLSIGFKTEKAAVHERTGIRSLLKLGLKELSVVTAPMNTKARVLSVKGEGMEEQVAAEVCPELKAIQDRLRESAEANGLALMRRNLRDGTNKFQSMDQYLRGKKPPVDKAVTL